MTTFVEKIRTKVLHEDVYKNIETMKDLETKSDFKYDIVSKEIKLVHESSCAGENLIKDIEMFVDFNGNDNNTVFSKFKTSLKGSEPLLKNLLNTPICDIDILTKRTNVLLNIDSNLNKTNDDKWQRLKELENDVAWIFIEKDDNLKDLFNIIYFKWLLLDKLNKNPAALTSTIFYKIVLSPLVGILSPIVYFIVPYLVLRYKFGFKDISFLTYLRITYTSLMSADLFSISNNNILRWVNIISQTMSLLFYFQGVFNSIELSKTFYKISKHIVEKMNSVAEFTTISNDIIAALWDDNIPKLYFVCENDKTPYDIGFQSTNFTLLSNFGKQLSAFKALNLEGLKKLMKKTYILDTLYSVATYKKVYNAVYPKYVDDMKPNLQIKGMWHPCLPIDKAVKNDIGVGNDSNAIITGPNAGGKSTFIKSLLVNIVYAQTICISLASSLTFTPLHLIHSQINLPDNKGHESLFEAEMYRCKSILDMLKVNPEKRMIIVMDEIFNSTNPVEGIAGAYAILKKISQYPNSIVVFTTHYAYLTKLEKQTQKFINYRMNVTRSNNNISYPYILDRGVSKQYIALELLQRNGFDNDIISEALVIKEKFTSK